MQTRWCSYQIRQTPKIDREWRASKHAILAYYIGGWRKGESPLDSLARALGIPPEDILPEAISQTVEHVELQLLFECLETGWVELPGLNIEKGIVHVITLVNQKLARVPPEVRAYFGAPKKLCIARLDWRPGTPQHSDCQISIAVVSTAIPERKGA